MLLWLFLLLTISCHSSLAKTKIDDEGKSAITYELRESRFGDHLILYCNAKRMAYKYGMDFLYRPFIFSDQLQMHQLEKKYQENQFEKKISVKYKNELKKHLTNDVAASYIICEVGFKKQKKESSIKSYDKLYHFVNEEPEFKKNLCKMINPIYPFAKSTFPENHITVAVHVRKGGGYDKISTRSTKATKQFVNLKFPLKFPPDQYYIDQILSLSKLVNHKPLFIHIFTDDKNPKKIAATFSHALKLPNITFSYREHGNNHYSNVLEDFFAMTQFDCLIRPDSRFSQAAQLIADYKIIMYPKNSINKVEIIQRKQYETYL